MMLILGILIIFLALYTAFIISMIPYEEIEIKNYVKHYIKHIPAGFLLFILLIFAMVSIPFMWARDKIKQLIYGKSESL